MTNEMKFKSELLKSVMALYLVVQRHQMVLEHLAESGQIHAQLDRVRLNFDTDLGGAIETLGISIFGSPQEWQSVGVTDVTDEGTTDLTIYLKDTALDLERSFEGILKTFEELAD